MQQFISSVMTNLGVKKAAEMNKELARLTKVTLPFLAE